jgi:DNA-binding NarL/FixJ family response regulator
VRILVADDHEVVRMGLRALLETQPGWIVCGEASTGREAVTKAIKLRPDVVVIDISMPELNGLDATRQILRSVSTAILILTVHQSEVVAREAIEAGARGYVLKIDAGRKLVDAVRALITHQEFFSPYGDAVSGMTTDAGTSPSGEARRLTPREREVLQLLVEGRTNKEIAAALGISVKTAETHRARIMAKLRLHSMSELVRYAIRNRIIEP